MPLIDWSPFFHTWEMRGRYPAILDDPEKGVEATKLFHDAQKLLLQIVAEKQFRAAGVYGIYHANSVGDDIEVYADANRSEVIARFHTLRQQLPKKDKPNYALADFIAPRDCGRIDYIGGFAVTTGHGADEFAKAFTDDLDDSSIMAKALADRLAEAFAEYTHKRVRDHFQFGKSENLSHEDVLRERYRGIRPAPGYPAQPDHTEKEILFQLLNASEEAGIVLTESMAMHPGASVSGIYFNHPDARYFGVGQITKDQLKNYAERKGITIEIAERWLGPWLAY